MPHYVAYYIKFDFLKFLNRFSYFCLFNLILCFWHIRSLSTYRLVILFRHFPNIAAPNSTHSCLIKILKNFYTSTWHSWIISYHSELWKCYKQSLCCLPVLRMLEILHKISILYIFTYAFRIFVFLTIFSLYVFLLPSG